MGVSYMMQKKIQFEKVKDPALIGAKFRNQYRMQIWTSDMKYHLKVTVNMPENLAVWLESLVYALRYIYILHLTVAPISAGSLSASQ